jgi:lysophospholipase L1-like esterase
MTRRRKHRRKRSRDKLQLVQLVQAPAEHKLKHVLLPPHATAAILTFLALIAIPEFVPQLQDYKAFDWRTALAVLDFAPRRVTESPLEEEQKRLRPEIDPSTYVVRTLEDSAGAMESFYEALHRVESGEAGAQVRILHYGDSPTTADLITADTRAALQKQFGNAGHGFCLIAKPWAWYEHRGVSLSGGGWKIEPANQSQSRDGLFGLGGVSFRGEPGAWSRAALRETGHTSVEISYLKMPGGGRFSLEIGDQTVSVDTSAPETGSGYARFPAPPGERRFEIRVTDGTVRLFGYRFEKPGPGLVYSSLGVNGAYVAMPARMFREEHWAGQLRHHAPDLVVINYGTNESVYPDFLDRGFASELKEIVRRVRAAVPDASILVMSPMDRGKREASGEIGTVPALHRVVDIEQRVAHETGCAFFNTFQAMGGSGTMGRWYLAEPRLVSADFIHPMPAGARIVGNLLSKALMDGYNKYKLERMRPDLARRN